MADPKGNPPSATLYVRNINERINLTAVTDELRLNFELFGTILEIVAKKSLKRKGQAFVVFETVQSAQDALEDMQGFEMFEKVIELQYAKTRSDATVKKEDGEEGLEAHKTKRLAEKDRKQQAEEAAAKEASAKRAAEEELEPRAPKAAKPNGAAAPNVPLDYLPPSKTLFLSGVPKDYTPEMLSALFVRFPGFKEVRMVPGRDLAFVEYKEIENAIEAKEAYANLELGGNKIKITFLKS